MLITEITEQNLPTVEAKATWARKGKKVVRKFRCTTGQRKGRIVASPSQCFAPIDIGKRQVLRKTKAKMGKRLTRKANRTKKFNPASRRVQTLNRK